MEEKDNPIMCMDYSPDGTLFATAGNDRNVRLYDDNMKTMTSVMRPGGLYNPGHSNRVFSLCFNKSLTGMIASGGWDNTVQFYDARSSTITNSIYGPHICGDSIDFKDYQMLTGAWSTKDQIQIWDIRTYKLLKTVEWDKCDKDNTTYVYASQFAKNKDSGIYGVGCSNNNIVRLFDRDRDDVPITTSRYLNKACYTVDFSNNGKYFAFGSGDGMIRVLNVETNK